MEADKLFRKKMILFAQLIFIMMGKLKPGTLKKNSMPKILCVLFYVFMPMFNIKYMQFNTLRFMY